MFSVRHYHQGNQVLVAACDPALLGTQHKEGPLRLEVNQDFYGSDPVPEAELRRQLSGCTVANLVGPETIAVAVDMGLVAKEQVRQVDGVPHAQMVTL